MLVIDDPLPQRPNQADEPGGLNDGPAGGFEFLRGLVGHIALSIVVPASLVISSIADVL
jgi:hypothetical protein